MQHCKAGNLVVNKLLQDYMALLDHGLGEVAQEADTIMTTATGPHIPAAPQDMPDWAVAGMKNCRGQMH